MKGIKLISFLMALVMVFTLFTACGEDTTKDEDNDTKVETQKKDDDDSVKVEMPKGLNAEKIEKLKDAYSLTVGNGGVYYETEDDKFGVSTFDGSKGSGAEYTSCEVEGVYFKVRTVETIDNADITSRNCYGLVNAKGDVIVPFEYADFEVLNERYVKVVKATGVKSEYDETVLCTFYGDETIYCTGTWEVYDVEAGKLLEGVSGTSGYVYAYGNYVKYKDTTDEYVIVNHKGENLPDDATLLENGSYILPDGNRSVVYDSLGHELFDFKADDYAPNGMSGKYYLGSKYDDGFTYVVMDSTGKVVSDEYKEYPEVIGNLIFSDGQVYNFDGDKVISGTYDRVSVDPYLGFAYLLKADDEYTLIKEDGTVLYQVEEDDDLSVDTSSMLARKKVDGDYNYYSFKDEDYTIEGDYYSLYAPWLVAVDKSNNVSDIVDSISGKTIIDGYNRYLSATVTDEAIYVYAKGAGNGYDIYMVK